MTLGKLIYAGHGTKNMVEGQQWASRILCHGLRRVIATKKASIGRAYVAFEELAVLGSI